MEQAPTTETQAQAQERWAASADRAAAGLRDTAATTDDPTIKRRAEGHAAIMEHIAHLQRQHA